MNARSMTRTATMVAMALTMMATTSVAAPKNGLGAVSCRTVASWTMSAWTAPAAVVLTSPEAWVAWNREMVDSGRAVAEEAMPKGVDWKREALVVLAMGEVDGAWTMSVNGAARTLACTEMSLHVAPGQGGSSPAVVVAMNRAALRTVRLAADYTLAGMPEQAQVYAPAALAAAADAPVTLATTWGAMKADYR